MVYVTCDYFSPVIKYYTREGPPSDRRSAVKVDGDLCKSGGFEDVTPFYPLRTFTPPKFNSSPLKNDAWKMILSFWNCLFFGANC